MVILHGKSSGSCMVFQVEISYLFLLCCCWDTVNWRESISSGNIYYPPCLHSDQAPQLMKASAASLFLLLSAPFSAHQHFTPAQMHSSQERAFSLFPFTFHSKCVYNQLSGTTDITSNSLYPLRNTHDFCLFQTHLNV